MTGVERVIQVYSDAWNEPDRARRVALLERCWDERGVFTDPRSVISEREALVDYMASYREAYPGCRSELVTAVDEHHGRFRFGWQIVGPGDAPVVRGVDFGELSRDGRIAWITSFEGWV